MTEFITPGTQWFALPSPFAFKRGGMLHGARLAYETWGELSPARDNGVLILTGLSPSAHAARNPGNPAEGWWERMVGPGKPIDTARWFVVCVNTLGSCKGSTGPASIDPDTGAAYRLRYPDLSLEDGANAAAALVRGLGIERLACLVGCSMGGMSALALLAHHQGIARTHLNLSGAAQALPFSIAIRSLQREAIRLDPNWNQGQYQDDRYPENGMRIARKLGVVTYRSSLEWRGRFGRVRLEPDARDDEPFGSEFQIESYLDAHADRFARAFDPNCYLYLSRSMDWFDLGESTGRSIDEALASIELERALAIGVETDILFPLNQQEEIAEGLRAGGVPADFAPLSSPQGHDAFLVDHARFGPVIERFLARL
ncbi:MAG TPA: homoserine O-acetyltransferase [Xanthomonadaceae bacterium]|nr:homoserine O-acetyltransferase [Xanthomonadaceae bacterium]